MPQYIRHKSQCREIPEELLLSQWNHHITCSGRLRIRSQWTNAIVKGTLLTNGFLANFVTGGKHQINILLLFSQSHSENGPLRYIYVTNCDCKSESETFIWCLRSMLWGTSEKWLGYAFETRQFVTSFSHSQMHRVNIPCLWGQKISKIDSTNMFIRAVESSTDRYQISSASFVPITLH